jgi:hypothetical protein
MTKLTAAAIGALYVLSGAPALAQDGACGTVGSGGAAATDSTLATTLGTAGACDDGSQSLATGGSAAAVDGKADSRTHVVENPNQTMGTSQARAQDDGEWSRSKTRTRVRNGEELTSTTRTMSHVPGSAPVKSTSSAEADLSEPSTTGSVSGSGQACPPDQPC